MCYEEVIASGFRVRLRFLYAGEMLASEVVGAGEHPWGSRCGGEMLGTSDYR